MTILSSPLRISEIKKGRSNGQEKYFGEEDNAVMRK